MRRRTNSMARVARMGALLFSMLSILPAGAATFTVNSTADQDNANRGNGVCATSGGTCTLRAAIREANALAGADTINLPAGTYVLTRTGTGENAASTGDFDITQALTINGASATTSIITANDIDTIVAKSTSGANCSGGGFTSSGNNLDSANTCGFAAAGDLINTNPNLGALANNGGQTQTRALLAGSPAIDAGTNIGCPADDQRRFIRR